MPACCRGSVAGLMTTLALRCRCGNVRGVATKLSPTTCGRVICHCRDCQAFARFLGQPGIVNSAGGSDIFHTAPGRMRLTAGHADVACVRLSEKGLFRWYAACCRTPLANTAGARVPFVGILHSFIDATESESVRTAAVGRAVGVFGRDAIGGCPKGTHTKTPLGMFPRYARLIARWWLAGDVRPSALFDPTSAQPIAVPKILTREERRAITP